MCGSGNPILFQHQAPTTHGFSGVQAIFGLCFGAVLDGFSQYSDHLLLQSQEETGQFQSVPLFSSEEQHSEHQIDRMSRSSATLSHHTKCSDLSVLRGMDRGCCIILESNHQEI